MNIKYIYDDMGFSYVLSRKLSNEEILNDVYRTLEMHHTKYEDVGINVKISFVDIYTEEYTTSPLSYYGRLDRDIMMEYIKGARADFSWHINPKILKLPKGYNFQELYEPRYVPDMQAKIYSESLRLLRENVNKASVVLHFVTYQSDILNPERLIEVSNIHSSIIYNLTYKDELFGISSSGTGIPNESRKMNLYTPFQFKNYLRDILDDPQYSIQNDQYISVYMSLNFKEARFPYYLLLRYSDDEIVSYMNSDTVYSIISNFINTVAIM